MTYLRLGIIGYGAVARLHVAAMSSIPFIHLTAVFGPDLDRATALAKPMRATATDDLDAFARLVDAAVIASPSDVHVDQAVALLERGGSVLIELPAAATLEAGRSIERAAARSSGSAFGAHTARFLPAIAAIRDVVQSGRFGVVDAVSIERDVGKRERSWSDDPLLHHGQHAIDVLRAWTGHLAVREAHIREDLAMFELQLPEGGRGSVRITHGAVADRMSVRLQGTAGSLCSDGFGRLEGPAGVLPNHWVDCDPIEAYRGAIQAQDAAFVAALSGDPRAYPPLSETLANLAVVDAIRGVSRAR